MVQNINHKNSIAAVNLTCKQDIYCNYKNMNGLSLKYFFVLFIFVILSHSVCKAQNQRRSIRNPERELFGRTLNNKKEKKIKESRGVVRAKKKQEANENKLKRNYTGYVKGSRKQAIEIQSPEVQARMKENRKDAENRYKVKKKKITQNSRRAGKKYKK